jgi:hypothetical protein
MKTASINVPWPRILEFTVTLRGIFAPIGLVTHLVNLLQRALFRRPPRAEEISRQPKLLDFMTEHVRLNEDPYERSFEEHGHHGDTGK